MRAIILAVATTILLPAVTFAQAEKKVDVTGKWLVTVTTDAGSGTPTVTFKQQGDSISCHYSSQAFGEVDFKGTVKEGKIKFTFGTAVEGTNLTITYAGTVEGADAMKGTVD